MSEYKFVCNECNRPLEIKRMIKSEGEFKREVLEIALELCQVCTGRAYFEGAKLIEERGKK